MDIEGDEFISFLTCAQSHHLRYMCIGGYAVNYYGYHRHTADLDIWIAPTEQNKLVFINVLHCMGYTASETDSIKNEDITDYFKCSIGSLPDLIDILSIIHKDLSFEEAEKKMIIHPLRNDLNLQLVPYDFLKEAKLRSHRAKDWEDVQRLESLRNKK